MGLIIGGGVGCGGGGLACLFVGIAFLRAGANKKRLLATGVPGQAQVMGVTQTSMYVNNQPVVVLQLQITTATGAPYVVTRRETVPLIMVGRLTNGQPLPVMVNPSRPDDFVILWESALNPPGGFQPPQPNVGTPGAYY
jgi:hypothetical protein